MNDYDKDRDDRGLDSLMSIIALLILVGLELTRIVSLVAISLWWVGLLPTISAWYVVFAVALTLNKLNGSLIVKGDKDE